MLAVSRKKTGEQKLCSDQGLWCGILFIISSENQHLTMLEIVAWTVPLWKSNTIADNLGKEVINASL